MSVWLLRALTALALAVPFGAAADGTSGDAEIARIVKQLGSDDFDQREAAGKRLLTLGEPALTALRKASSSDDVEVRQRATRLVEAIEEKLPYKFNGKDLTGWALESGPKEAWQVEAGAIVARGHGSATRGWLLSQRTYGDFLFTCQFRLGEDADGGVGFRAEDGEKIGSLPMHLVVKLRTRPAASGKIQTGSLYYWLNTGEPLTRAAELKPADAWNDLAIEVRGQRL